MNYRWLVSAFVILGIIAADPAFARPKHKAKAACADQYVPAFTSDGFARYLFLPTDREPRPNGCAPPAYAYGKYVGQDPDPNIRFQLQRDPATGYSAHQN